MGSPEGHLETPAPSTARWRHPSLAASPIAVLLYQQQPLQHLTEAWNRRKAAKKRLSDGQLLLTSVLGLAIPSAAAAAVVAPIDRAKVLLQTEAAVANVFSSLRGPTQQRGDASPFAVCPRGQWQAPKSPSALTHCGTAYCKKGPTWSPIFSVCRRNVLRSAWTGGTCTASAIFLASGVRMAALQLSKPSPQDDGEVAISQVRESLRLGATAAAAMALVYPFDVIKSLLVTRNGIKPCSFTSIRAGVETIFREYGILGFYTSFSWSAVALLPFVFISTLTYPVATMLLGKVTEVRQQASHLWWDGTDTHCAIQHVHKEAVSTAAGSGLCRTPQGGGLHCVVQDPARTQYIVAAFLSARFAQLCTYPLDTLRRRMQVIGLSAALGDGPLNVKRKQPPGRAILPVTATHSAALRSFNPSALVEMNKLLVRWKLALYSSGLKANDVGFSNTQCSFGAEGAKAAATEGHSLPSGVPGKGEALAFARPLGPVRALQCAARSATCTEAERMLLRGCWNGVKFFIAKLVPEAFVLVAISNLLVPP